MLVIRRRDHEKRMARYHAFSLNGSLLGGCELIHEWGRLGSPGAVRQTPYPDEKQAENAAHAYIRLKIRKGYR